MLSQEVLIEAAVEVPKHVPIIGSGTSSTLGPGPTPFKEVFQLPKYNGKKNVVTKKSLNVATRLAPLFGRGSSASESFGTKRTNTSNVFPGPAVFAGIDMQPNILELRQIVDEKSKKI